MDGAAIGKTAAILTGLYCAAAVPPPSSDSLEPVFTDGDTQRPHIELTARTEPRASALRQEHLQVEVTLTAPEASKTEDSAFDLLVVLDSSVSMYGEKLRQAKRVLHALADRIRGAERFGLLTYESVPALVIPLQAPHAGARTRWHDAIDAITAGGGSNMSYGLDVAREFGRDSQTEGRRVRLLLLSDGGANLGDVSIYGLGRRVNSIARDGQVLNVLGIGDDSDRELLSALAAEGTGRFAQLSKTSELRLLEAELHRARHGVTHTVELRFEGKPGVQLLDASGYAIHRSAGASIVRPGKLDAGQTRRLWLTLSGTDLHDEAELGRFSVSYER